MIDFAQHPPLLIPEPLFIERLDKRVDVGNLPLGVAGVSTESLYAINGCIKGIFSVNINEEIFVLTKNSPQIVIYIDGDIREHFADFDILSRIAFNLNEAYVITIEQQDVEQKAQVYINAGNDAAAQHALITLSQLVNQYGTLLPSMVIRDMPVYPNRGLMLDISRDRVPRMEEIISLIDTLAFLKYNHLQLYTEHTFAYVGHETVWKNASPLTSTEIQAIDAYCQKLGITLGANQACFTHLTRWLKHKPYSKLAETNFDWEWDGNRFSGPFSLNPESSDSIELVKDMLGQLLPNFSGGIVNINCDEAIDLGKGATKELVEESSAFEVYWNFVNQIVEIVREYNFRPMFWADMWLKAPENERILPDKEVIALIWGYEPNAPFAEDCRALEANQREVWICPGTSSWRSITGRTDERRANIAEAAVQGLNNGAKGFLLTEWGDKGHRQKHPLMLFAVAEAAQSAWSRSQSDNDCTAISLQIFGDRQKLEIGKWLAKLGNIDADIRQYATKKKDNGKLVPLINASSLFIEMEVEFKSDCSNGTLEEWSGVEAELGNLSKDFTLISNKQFNHEIRHILKVAEFAVQKAILRREVASKQKQGLPILTKMMKSIINEHRTLWLLRSRIGGLDDSCKYYEVVLNDLIAHEKSL